MWGAVLEPDAGCRYQGRQAAMAGMGGWMGGM